MAVPRRLESAGDCSIGVTRDPLLDDRMRAALRFSDTGGRHHVVDLTLSDTRNLLEDLLVLLGANREQVDAWWARLADHRDGRPASPKAATRAGGR
jgi:hypothetical protein